MAKIKKEVKLNNKTEANKLELVFLIMVIVLSLFGIIYGLFFRDLNSYKTPIELYYKGLNSHKTQEVLKAYPKCLREHEGFVTLLEQEIKPSQDNKLKYEYKIKAKKVLSKKELEQEIKAYDSTCGVGVVKITTAYKLIVKNTEKYPSNEANSNDVTINVGKIGGKWYMLG